MQKQVSENRPERLLRAKEVYQDRLRISRSTFYDMLRNKDFPPAVRITVQRVGWPESAVDAWIKSRPVVRLKSLRSSKAAPDRELVA